MGDDSPHPGPYATDSPSTLAIRLMTPAVPPLCAWIVGVLLAVGGGGGASAGGGPENVLLVVNNLSDDSKTIANYYTRWRNLPAENVLHLTWRGSQQDCSVERFRKDLLVPAIRAIDERGLGKQIDYLVYSAGFPWRVDFGKDHPGVKFPGELRPVASLTGATYLWRYIVQKNPAIVSPTVNWYVPGIDKKNLQSCRDVAGAETRAFRARYLWAKEGTRTTDETAGQPYLLSAVLGVTAGRGNTVDEVLAYLRRSILADGKAPTGTFYFAHNQDVRSRRRHACFAGVAGALIREGAKARLVSGTVPRGVKDIVGLTAGAEFCELDAAQSSVLPGAICEHLTSFGGDLRKEAAQMPLTDFLRQGAAGASGTIVEPRALQAKFPLPSVHLHYFRGCSLAEAFYQSVASPYQLLIVGDPLCQPWADPPALSVAEVEPGQTVSGKVTLTPTVGGGRKVAGGVCELFVDGRLRARAPIDKPITLNTAQLVDGEHEMRLVAASADAIESRARVVLPVTVNNSADASLELTASPRRVGSLSEWVMLEATAPSGPGEVVFEHNAEEIGRTELSAETPAKARLRVRAKQLGAGPVRLRAHLEGHGAQASPVWIFIE